MLIILYIFLFLGVFTLKQHLNVLFVEKNACGVLIVHSTSMYKYLNVASLMLLCLCCYFFSCEQSTFTPREQLTVCGKRLTPILKVELNFIVFQISYDYEYSVQCLCISKGRYIRTMKCRRTLRISANGGGGIADYVRCEGMEKYFAK